MTFETFVISVIIVIVILAISSVKYNKEGYYDCDRVANDRMLDKHDQIIFLERHLALIKDRYNKALYSGSLISQWDLVNLYLEYSNTLCYLKKLCNGEC